MLRAHWAKVAVVLLLTHVAVMAQEPVGDVLPADTAYVRADSIAGVTAQMAQTEARRRRTVVALRTNLLLPLLNVGVEVPLGNRFSVGADWYYPWMPRSADHKNCFQIDGLSLEARCWLGKRHRGGEANWQHRLRGHSVGIFAMTGKYDLERNYSGHQGEYIMGGIDYLFAMPVFKHRMHFEFALGVGYFFSRAVPYDVFESGGRGYRHKYERKKYQYVGPLKANVTLVLPLPVVRRKTHEQP